MAGKMLIRADAGPDIGMGHVMRCFALALEWKRRGGSLVLLSAKPSKSVVDQWEGIGAQVIHLKAIRGSNRDLELSIAFIEEFKADWVVIDGYHFDSEYQAKIASIAHVLWIDDEAHAAQYTADFVLNQNPHAHEAMYLSRTNKTELLLGLDYTLIRSEFLGKRWQPAPHSTCPRVLVIMGGSDPDNLSLQIARSANKLSVSVDLQIIVGPSNPHLELLRKESEEAKHPWTLHDSPSDLAELFCSADLVITAAGSTSWELAYLGVPFVAIVIAGNQEPIAEELKRRQVAVVLERAKELSSTILDRAISKLSEDCAFRRQLSINAQRLVDGKGASRVCEALELNLLHLGRGSTLQIH